MKSITLPNQMKYIRASAFSGCSRLESITIHSSVEYIYQNAFSGCTKLKAINSHPKTPPYLYDNSFPNFSIPVNVPLGCKLAYQEAQGWKNFTTINDGNVYYNLIIKAEGQGMATFCPTEDVDFTNVEGVKAYIGSIYNRQTGTLILTRAYDVPAGTGVLLKGEPGTYKVAYCQSYSIVSNLLKGVTEATNVSATEGNYMNYVLSSGSQGVGFYKVGSAGASLEAGRAYLQIPAETAAGSRSSLKLRFDDEEEATGIGASLTNSEERIVNSELYDLQGRRVEKPQRGLYIRNGRKVVIK